jgi:hypothetical protein
MKTFSTITLGATVALLFAGAAAAAGAKLSDAQSVYQKERAACLSGQSAEDRDTCLREAGAALQQARRGGLGAGNEREFEQNRLIRCAALPEPDREDCVRRMKGEGITSGSVQQGGIFRELTRPVPPPAN